MARSRPFTDEPHFIQNLEDGTFHHSGSLAIRAATSAGARITYRLLYNDAVGMTGGQEAEGRLPVPQLTRWLALEGVRRIIVTTPEPERYRDVTLDPIASVRHRDALQAAQRELAEVDGVTVLIHDDRCATEKRRLRKRGRLSAPAQRVWINERVCEGCGDCGEVSTCLSVLPVETEFGRKTRIHQSSCNQDFTCLKGDCPSFLLVTPGDAAKHAKREPPAVPVELPEPVLRVPRDVLLRTGASRTVAVVNTAQAPTALMVTDTSVSFPAVQLPVRRIEGATRRDEALFVDAEGLAERLFGDHMPSNGADVTRDEEIGAAFDAAAAVAPLRVVVCCAGIGWAERLAGRHGTHTVEGFARVIAVNLQGTFHVVRHTARVLGANEPDADGQRGVCVLTTSIAAQDGQAGQVAYAASKAGVAGLTLPAARDLAPLGVHVCSIAPGTFETPLLAGLPQRAREQLERQVPWPPRLGRPDEFASLVLEVMRNGMLNGAVLRLDGGLRMPYEARPGA